MSSLVSCLAPHDPQLSRLADAIAEKVGPERFHVWFSNSTRLEMRNDALEIACPNDFISEWIGRNFARHIADAAQEVLGCTVPVTYLVVPELFDVRTDEDGVPVADLVERAVSTAVKTAAARPVRPSVATRQPGDRPLVRPPSATPGRPGGPVVSQADAVNLAVPRPGNHAGNGGNHNHAFAPRPRLRHDLASFVVGPSSQLAFNTVNYVSEFPGSQYNPLFVHGNCGLGKTHLLQGLCKRFAEHHPTKRWMYMTGEEFTNDFLVALRSNKVDSFRRRMRDLDLLVIDDVHFLGGKKATQEEFLHTFNAIEAGGRQVVMASDNHPKLIEEFGESLVNRFVSGMVVRIDPPNAATRAELLRSLAVRAGVVLGEDVIAWVARRVTQSVRELEGAVTRIAAHAKLTQVPADLSLAQAALGDLDQKHVAPVRPEHVMQAVCDYFGLEHKDLMSGRRQRTISLARSVAMYLVRKNAKLSFPEIGNRMGKRNHSTVISACRRIEAAVGTNEPLAWTSSVGERTEEAAELVQRLEEHSRAMTV